MIVRRCQRRRGSLFYVETVDSFFGVLLLGGFVCPYQAIAYASFVALYMASDRVVSVTSLSSSRCLFKSPGGAL